VFVKPTSLASSIRESGLIYSTTRQRRTELAIGIEMCSRATLLISPSTTVTSRKTADLALAMFMPRKKIYRLTNCHLYTLPTSTIKVPSEYATLNKVMLDIISHIENLSLLYNCAIYSDTQARTVVTSTSTSTPRWHPSAAPPAVSDNGPTWFSLLCAFNFASMHG
jgi:hypothetical protein